MSAKIRDVLDLPIQKGYLNWEDVKRKIFAVLETVGGDFTKIKDSKTGKFVKMKTDDAIVLKIRKDGINYAIKLICPRFKNGKLICNGFQSGKFNNKNLPYFYSETLRYF